MTDAAHAKNYPPSSAKRWLSCSYSAIVASLYNRDDTDQSKKGDRWHYWMECKFLFGTYPKDVEPDAAWSLDDLYAKVMELLKVAGPTARLYVEVRLDIPQTGEFGTADLLIVSDTHIIVLDLKSGYVAVDVVRNSQMLIYLLGAIALHGTRPNYMVGIYQPNHDHIDGPYRTYEVTEYDVPQMESAIEGALAQPDRCVAGHWCKETYCEHRGACDAFMTYCMNDLSLGWHTSELKATTDADLAKALDASDELAGWRTELRAEAMRRIMNMDREIHGYKVVKGRRSRAVTDAANLVLSTQQQLGAEWAFRLFPDLSWAELDLLPAIAQGAALGESILKALGTPKHIEDVIKQYARVHNMPRGAWKTLYDNVVGDYIRETASGLTLERAIDGRPAHRRGSEFAPLTTPQTQQTTNIL